MDVNKNGVQFNFLKNLEIIHINNEVEQLHPSTQEFWEREHIRKSLLDFLANWSRNPAAYAKKILNAQDEAANVLKSGNKKTTLSNWDLLMGYSNSTS